MVTRATHYSRPVVFQWDGRIRSAFSHWATLLWLGSAMAALAADKLPTNAPVAYLERQLTEARLRRDESPQSSVAAWQFAQACFNRAEFSTNDAQRASLARAGIEAAKVALAKDSNSAPAHFYLAMNMGQLARTKSLGALSLVEQMEQEFMLARAMDEQFEHAGPDRFLGRLYFEAPTTVSVGSRTKARKHFARAAQLQPDYPENRLNLIESALRWKETKTARKEAERYAALLTKARTQFTGEAWQAAWLDWDARWEKVRKELKL